jgi:VWFA-related protein
MLLPTQRNTRSRLGLAAFALVAIALAALGTPGSAWAQGQPLTVNVVGFSADDWPSPQVILTVEDAQGQPLADLDPSAFQAYLNDEPAPVTAVTRAVDGSLPIAIVLALDVSGSMEGAALDQAKAAAGVFLDSLGPLDTVAVLTFSDNVTLVQPFTLDRDAARFAIGALSAGGRTALYPAVAESARLAASAGAARRAVVLLSDGGLGVLVTDPGDGVVGAQTREGSLAAAEALGVPVFAIGLGTEIDRDFLGSLADATGGQFAETPSPEGLTVLYQQVAERLRGQYVVTLNASAFQAPLSDAATLRVDVASGELAGNGERVICPQSVCVAIPGLADGARIEEAQTVSAEVVAEDPVTSVNFLLDGQSLATVADPPYEFTLDPATLAGGEHAFVVEVTTEAGTTEAREVSVQLGAAAASGSSMNLALIAVVAIVIVVVVLFAWFVLLRRRRGDEPEARPVVIPQPPLAPKSEVPILERLEKDRIEHPRPVKEEARGQLLAVGGPIQGEAFALGANPVSIGSGSRCRIRLEEVVDGAEIPSEYARVWIRDGKLMVHELRRLTAVGSVGGRWEILTHGDMFSLGPYTFRFELSGEEAGPSGVNGSAAPVGSGTNGASAADAPALTPANKAEPLPPATGRLWASGAWGGPGTAEEQAQAARDAQASGTAPNGTDAPAPADSPFARPAGAAAAAPQEEPAPPGTDLLAAGAGGPAPAVDPAPDVPNILRDKPPAGEAPPAEAAPATEEPAVVPNVLRDAKPPLEGAAPELAGQPEPEIPNVLRDRPERDEIPSPGEAPSNEPPGSL